LGDVERFQTHFISMVFKQDPVVFKRLKTPDVVGKTGFQADQTQFISGCRLSIRQQIVLISDEKCI
jgi:hypothetical protein